MIDHCCPDSKDIVDSWALPFDKLYTPSHGNSFVKEHSDRIISEVQEIINKTNEFCYILDKDFTVTEVELAWVWFGFLRN